MSLESLFRHLPALLTPMLLVGLATTVPAADAGLDDVVDDVTVDELVEFMDNEGYAVEVHERGFVQWKLDGFRCQVFIADDSESMQFHASFSDGNATLKRANEWNATKRYSRSYIDEEGDPHLELDLDMCGGVTPDRIRDFLKTCKVSFAAWRTEVVE